MIHNIAAGTIFFCHIVEAAAFQIAAVILILWESEVCTTQVWLAAVLKRCDFYRVYKKGIHLENRLQIYTFVTSNHYFIKYECFMDYSFN